jgi:acyl-CoA synthetase (AMP-forming)/AMP-acid ligase II
MAPEDYFPDGPVPSPERLASSGKATASSEIQILDDRGLQVAAGGVGEIGVRGDFVMDGYLNRDGREVEWRDRQSFHMTGDLGTLSPDGYLTILGRARDVIISGGFNVFPAEVEAALMELSDIRECAVFGVPDRKWGESVWAAVELHRGHECTEGEVISFARGRLGTVKAPKRVIVVDELPRNSAGKVQKRDLGEWARRMEAPAQ